jgi:hypothetical protein
VSQAWCSRFATYLASIGFVEAKSDTSLEDTVYLLYVDDIVFTASNADLLQRTIIAIQREFVMKDLEPLHHFLGITAECRPQSLFLHQRQYAINILERAGMFDCKPCSTPVDTQAKLSEDDRPLVADARHNVLPEPDRCAPVPHLLPARHRLRRLAGVPPYAHYTGAPSHRSQVDPALPPRLPRLRPPPPTILDVGTCGLHRR